MGRVVRLALAELVIVAAAVDWLLYLTIWHHPGWIHVVHHLAVTVVCVALHVALTPEGHFTVHVFDDRRDHE